MRGVIALGGAAGLLVAVLTMNVNTTEVSAVAVEPTTSTIAQTPSYGLSQTVSRSAVGERQREASDRIMVRVTGDIDAWAMEHGVDLIKRPGVSGFAAVGVPAGESAASLVDRLTATGTVDAAPMALMYGTGKPTGKDKKSSTTSTTTTAGSTSDVAVSGETPGPSSFQWHLDAADMQRTTYRADGVVVAVVDSGVAYLTTAEDGESFNRAESLAGVPIVAPWDFVEDDALPLDEHQHGTHIASIIASQGDLVGIAQGVSLMPLRVLDENNAGTELDLVEALHWAVDNGADVVNLSLAFPTGYLPSLALEEALERCHIAGVVVVAATGNDGASIVSWPAASPSVIAVGASAPGVERPHPAVYSNRDPKVDFLAPGGDMETDINLDGYPDGVLAETIALNEPTEPGLWFMEGTSQAAAIASATSAILLAQGYAPQDVRTQLQYTVHKDFGPIALSAIDGVGTGSLSIFQAASFGSEAAATSWMGDYTVAVLPYLEERDDQMVVPHARLTLLLDGEIAQYGAIHGSFWGSTESYWSCEVDRLQPEGHHCDVSGPPVHMGDVQAAWLVSADLVTAAGGIARPTAAAFQSDELDVILAAMDDNPETAGGTVGFYWEAGDTAEFGRVAEGYSIADLGSGLLSSPMGLLVRRRAIIEPSAASLDLDGTGLLSSPMGLMQVRVLSLWGSGLLSSPMGFQFDRRFVFMDGTGLLSSPMGFRSTTLLAKDPTTTTYSISLSSGASSDSGSYTSTVLEAGGWTHGPSAMVSLGAAHVPDNGLESILLPAVEFTR